MAGTTTYYGISYPTNTDYVTNGASAMQTIATGFDSAVAIPTYNAQTGTTYTFALTDIGKTVTANNAAAQTYTIPPTSSVTWPTNATLNVVSLGAGTVTFAAGAGVTVTNTAQTLAQYQSANLVRTGSNAWTVLPDSGGASSLTLIKAQTIGSAVSSVAVTGVFSTTFDNYFIAVNNSVPSVNNNLTVKLGSTTTGYYGGASSTTYATSAFAGTADNNAAAWTNVFVGIGSTDQQGAFILISPFLTRTTILQANRISTTSAGSFNGYLNNTTSYTDFTLTTTTGTITGGTIYVYGYAKV